MHSRRQFLKQAALGTAALALPRMPRRSMRLLILGGTSFTGPHLVRLAIERGHTVTTFTRGLTAPALHGEWFAEAEMLTGDRDGDLSALEGRNWDVVLDNSGRSEDWTRASAELLRNSAELYAYTSSTGVFYPYLGSGMTEATPVALALPEDRQEDGAMRYGVMKAASEQVAREVFGHDRSLIFRPTYIVGPGDRSNRFPYWPARLARGRRVLAPGLPDDPVQFIDVRDLTRWMLDAMEARFAGTWNLAGPGFAMGMRAFLHGAHAAFSSAVEWVYVHDHAFFQEHGIEAYVPWILPVGDNYGSARIDPAKAHASGLTHRPLAQTVADTWAWWQSPAVSQQRRDSLSGERSLMAREAELLAAWQARS
ncbi:MAG: NAD-dependent epimerase/dehydratase family protein [Rhodothermales bacterium]|nr:NAD-dependent epimerase/dehydratase family protein [Rhodothermales bacterium]MBO6780648.1 NAD-dependent epimerase/dehydratase family protein [Rhodothermales bacterium]